MPTEIQYGVEVGGRKWALSRGEKHSNNMIKRRRWGKVEDTQTMQRTGFQLSFQSAFLFHLQPLLLSLSLHLFVTLFAVFLITFSSVFHFFPRWCSAHSGVATIGMYSLFDPAAESKQVFQPGSVCATVEVSVFVCVCRGLLFKGSHPSSKCHISHIYFSFL